MKTKIIACKTIEDEIICASSQAGVEYPVVWLESGLHNNPKDLNARLQSELNEIDADRVLLAFGFCGNALLGLETGDYTTVIPRADDCISLLIGSNKERSKISAEYAAYFLTDGWMRGERNIWVEYQHSLEKYGQELTDMIMEKMFGHYRTLGLLDSGVIPIEALMESTRVIADTLSLEQKVIPATLSFVGQLLTGPWERDKFIVKPPHTTVTADDMLGG